jgi:hypothetical protein
MKINHSYGVTNVNISGNSGRGVKKVVYEVTALDSERAKKIALKRFREDNPDADVIGISVKFYNAGPGGIVGGVWYVTITYREDDYSYNNGGGYFPSWGDAVWWNTL